MHVAKAGRHDYSPCETDGSSKWNENMCIMKIYCGYEVFVYIVRSMITLFFHLLIFLLQSDLEHKFPL
jgi:hypothetical protein